jgi:hypothetical protein
LIGGLILHRGDGRGSLAIFAIDRVERRIEHGVGGWVERPSALPVLDHAIAVEIESALRRFGRAPITRNALLVRFSEAFGIGNAKRNTEFAVGENIRIKR